MRLLLDENLPRLLAKHLLGHECRTVTECGWAGKRNRELLQLAEPFYDVLLTLDKNVPFQQNLAGRKIAVLVLRARSSRIQDLIPVVPACLAAPHSIKPGSVVRVGDR